MVWVGALCTKRFGAGRAFDFSLAIVRTFDEADAMGAVST